MRLATTMMSLTLAEVFILAPEPIVMATSFSVRVWQIYRNREQRGDEGGTQPPRVSAIPQSSIPRLGPPTSR